MELWKIYLIGILMGSADVVPGVSGGTMAFIMGIYEELVNTIRNLGNISTYQVIKKEGWKIFWKKANLTFLIVLLSGIATAILSLSRLIVWLLANKPVYIWSFFFGLILASIYTVFKRINKFKIYHLFFFLVGGIFSYYLVGIIPIQTPNNFVFLFLTGALSICAMILPGISGAYIMLLLGKYRYSLECLHNHNFLPLMVMGTGAVVGIILFSKFLSYLLQKYHDPMVAVLAGFMLGSLRKVWPWKVTVKWMVLPHKKLPLVQHNYLPQFTSEVSKAFLLFSVAIIAIFLLELIANKKKSVSAEEN
jgi:putative membrane protein